MSKTIIDHARAERGDEAAASLSGYFNRMSMPFPMLDECRQTADGGYILFMNDYGVVLRITDDELSPLHRHGRVLHPLASKTIGMFRFDINPGIHVSKDCHVKYLDQSEDSEESKDLQCLFEELARDGITYCDMFKLINFGTLPGPNPYWVVVDTPSLKMMGHEWITSLREKYQYTTPPDIQKRLVGSDALLAVQEDLYKPVRRHFDEAWPQSSERPSLQALGSFWKSCEKAKESGHLLTSWLNKDVWDDRNNESYQGKYSTRFYNMQLG